LNGLGIVATVKQPAIEEEKDKESRTIQQSLKEEQKNDLTPWEKFINQSTAAD
jgi:hypothetical protein